MRRRGFFGMIGALVAGTAGAAVAPAVMPKQAVSVMWEFTVPAAMPVMSDAYKLKMLDQAQVRLGEMMRANIDRAMRVEFIADHGRG